MSSRDLENLVRPSADRFLIALKMRGPQTAAELGCATGICGEAARQQLVRLASEGLVDATARPGGVGRPAQVWALTPAGDARFPDAHSELAATLIRLIRREFGDAALERLVQARADEVRQAYAQALEGATDLQERVARLAALRTREGYMAEWRPDGDGFLLLENHCPIPAAATACGAFCKAELETFRTVLGPGVTIEPTEHIVQGDRRCAYRILPQ
jgi:predicted ArsR family transcriptional regulator